MNPIKVLIVDDEPLARDIMESYIQKIPGLEVAGRSSNALEAFSMLNKQQIDLLLIDINMPEISGIDFIKSLKQPPLLIFTTAYSEYAVESYELSAIDYLLKPISFDRFLKAINKAVALLQNKPEQPTSHTTTPTSALGDNMIFVKSDGKLLKIDITQLWLIEGLKDYLKLHTDSGKIIVHSTMKNFEEQLAQFPFFVRVNKSYIINIKYITEIDGNMIRLKDQHIPIGNTYKDDVHKLFDSYKLL
jgi:DNA-binding LytR/AlgR family response regulator